MVQLLHHQKDRALVRPDELISLKEAGLRGGALAMRALNAKNLESLLCSDPATWDPVLVTASDVGIILLDGYHRCAAAKQLGLEQIVATCQPFTETDEVIETAFRANLKHGLRSSEENKSDYIFWLSVTYPEMEQSDIAKRVGVGP